MINCEEKFLKSTISKIKRFAAEHSDVVSFYREIEALGDLSLQTKSFKSDDKFFDCVNRLISVIVTIFTHPHIINKAETVIVRAEQAYSLTPEMFNQTVKDNRLWRDKRGEMVPESVYYYQNIDEIKTYENRFIVHLIDLVYDRLSDYASFYTFLVGTIGNENVLSQSNSDLERAFDKLDMLTKKIKRLRHTYFYKEVKKLPFDTRRIELTNVLLKNRAYLYCYRFYRDNVTYGDRSAAIDDLKIYYYVQLIAGFKRAGYELDESSKSELICYDSSGTVKTNRPLAFTAESFTVTITDTREFDGLFIAVKNKRARYKEINPATYLLTFDGTVTFDYISGGLEKYRQANAVTVDAMSVWCRAKIADDVVPARENPAKESVLVDRYIAEKTCLIPASQSIYESHCPVCRGRNLENGGVKTRCAACGAEYTFVSGNKGKYIWLLNFGRK